MMLVLFSFVLIGLTELGLRLAGFGGVRPFISPLLVRANAPAEIRQAMIAGVNPSAVSIFFARPSHAENLQSGSVHEEKFILPKPPGTVRVLFFGESTIEGFPYPRNLTSCAFLQSMLRHVMPSRKVEVINLGVTAVASFPIRILAIEAINKCQPDLVVAYAGHNEYFGAFGMASTQSAGLGEQAMKFAYLARQSAIVQGMIFVMQRLVSMHSSGMPEQLIEIMAASRSIEPQGPLCAAAGRSLSTNLRAIAREARRNTVPVVLCTVASNERDFAPVASWGKDLSVERQRKWETEFAAAKDMITSSSRDACAILEQLVRDAPRHAAAHYAYARALDTAGETSGAVEQYRLGRDLDTMPWRASRPLNMAVRQAAQIENALLADCESAFASVSGNAPGWDLFDDHLHPNLHGQALIAQTVFDVIVRNSLLPVDPSLTSALPDWQQMAEELGYNNLERYRVVNMMSALFKRPPLSINNEAAARRYSHMLSEMESRADTVENTAVERWQMAGARSQQALPISYFGGASALKANDIARAHLYFTSAIANSEPYTSEKCAAQYLSLLTLPPSLKESPAKVKLRQSYMNEAELVEILQKKKPDPLLARVLAGYHSLMKNEAKAKQYLTLAEKMPGEANPRIQAYASEFPKTEH
ncbi:MAG: SGNH/GDSL hydrolase family protein [bacterium]